MNEAAIVKTICARNGSIGYDELLSALGMYDEVLDFLDSIIDNSESFSVAFVNGRRRVIVRTKVRLCRAQNCPSCENLHLCKGFLFGCCRFDSGRRRCRFSHDLLSVHNMSVLAANDLQTLDLQELRILLLQSDYTLLPAVCYSYNNGMGEYGRCQEAENCRRLHICEKYLRGFCSCSRSHDFYEPHPRKTLEDRGVTSELMAIMKDVYSNIEALKQLFKNNSRTAPSARTGWKVPKRRLSSAGNDPEPMSRPQFQTEKSEICMYFIKGHCKHGDSCRREHSLLPYKWEVKEGTEWKALPGNEAIEKDYCDPAKTYCSGFFGVCFDTMTQGSQSVRRLSTVPSVLQPTFILTTEWLWYWEDEYGDWIQYANPEGGHKASSISSVELEQKYQADNSGVVEFTAGQQTYELNLKDMIQANKVYKTKKVVRRRPKFVSAADVKTIKTTKRTPNNFKALPENWDKALTPETGFKRIQLLSNSVEYGRIQALFGRTMVGYSILQIERIQNKALWEVFQWQKDYMKKNNKGRDVAEKQLFHGTNSKFVDTICLNNFDWRICGVNGTAYGKGSYFARDAKYSHDYTNNSGTRSMFVCRILVGDYTKGDPSYLRPPSKDGGDTIFYNSCVNDMRDPSIFVVFEKHQIYPEYLIQYRDSGVAVPAAPSTVRSRNLTRPASYNTSASSALNSFISSASSYVPPSQSPSLYSVPSRKPAKPDNSCVIS